jgi:hypothetical protein
MSADAMVLQVVLPVLAVMLALWLAAQRASKSGGLTLTRVTHLACDAKAGWLHVLGARRTSPEYGDAVDHWAHAMVEPRTGRWLFGERSVGGDLDLGAPMVKASLERLEPALGQRPAPVRTGSLRVHVRHEANSAAAAPALGLVIDVSPRVREPATQPCKATLFVDHQARGTHAFEALGDGRFRACVLEEARVVVFTYVGVAWGDPQAHLVAFERDSGAVLFDCVCTHPSA